MLIRDDYKGHTIFTYPSGPEEGPWVATFSAWSVDEMGCYSCVVQGTAPGVYFPKKLAKQVAFTECKRRIETLLTAEALRGSDRRQTKDPSLIHAIGMRCVLTP